MLLYGVDVMPHSQSGQQGAISEVPARSWWEKPWRRERGEVSLSDVYGSIGARGGGNAKRMAAFLGPGYLVATGYMDPGNWATALAGGSSFGFALLSVALISNIMAILLQMLLAELGRCGHCRDHHCAQRQAAGRRSHGAASGLHRLI